MGVPQIGEVSDRVQWRGPAAPLGRATRGEGWQDGASAPTVAVGGMGSAGGGDSRSTEQQRAVVLYPRASAGARGGLDGPTGGPLPLRAGPVCNSGSLALYGLQGRWGTT